VPNTTKTPIAISGSALELIRKCERHLTWIRTEGVQRNDLQAAAEFADGLARAAAELHALLEDERKRHAG
jgi:hypothetical protein